MSDKTGLELIQDYYSSKADEGSRSSSTSEGYQNRFEERAEKDELNNIELLTLGFAQLEQKDDKTDKEDL